MIDLGDGLAIAPWRVDKVFVVPPSGMVYLRGFVECFMYAVMVVDSDTHVVYTIGLYWSRDDAHYHARQIIQMMQEEINE